MPIKHRQLLTAASLLLFTLAAYLPVMINAGFIWDDDDYLVNNQVLRAPDGLCRIWLNPKDDPQYYPAVLTTFYVEYHLWGLQPAGYHIDNILLHAFNAIMVWLILTRLRIPGAYVAAAIFAVHPMTVESVAWVTERKNVLSLAFYLAAFWMYMRFEPAFLKEPVEPARRRWGFYAATLLLFFLALMSKSTAFSLPLALAILLWYVQGRIRLRWIVPLIPLMILGVLSAAYTAYFERHYVGANGPEWAFRWVDRILIAGRAYVFYPVKLLLPINLSFIYPRWVLDPAIGWQWLFPALAAIILIVPIALLRRWGRGPLAAILFYSVSILPALGFANIWTMRYSFVADHYSYLACLGLFALVAAWLAQTTRIRSFRVRTAIAGTLIALCLVMSFDRGFIYQNAEAIWVNTLLPGKNPDSFLALDNLGLIEMQRNNLPRAMELMERSLALKPDNHQEVYGNLGSAYLRAGRLDDAERVLQAGYAQPGQKSFHAFLANSLGFVRMQRGDLPGALTMLQEAADAGPPNTITLGNLARVEFLLGRDSAARIHAQQALALDPRNTKASGVLDQLAQKAASQPATDSRPALPPK